MIYENVNKQQDQAGANPLWECSRSNSSLRLAGVTRGLRTAPQFFFFVFRTKCSSPASELRMNAARTDDGNGSSKSLLTHSNSLVTANFDAATFDVSCLANSGYVRQAGGVEQEALHIQAVHPSRLKSAQSP